MNKFKIPLKKIERIIGKKLKKNSKVLGVDTACYSSDTEILTDQGWKLFKDLDRTEKVATLNPKTHYLEYQKPIKYFKYDYKGEMYKIKSRTIDLLVTPNHNIYYKPSDYKNLPSYYRFKPIANFSSYKAFIPISCNWGGKKQEYFVLPKVKYFYYNSNQFKKGVKKWKYCSKKQIKMEDWLGFLGWYISEGSCYSYKGGHYISISQTNKKYKKEIRKCLSKLPFHFKEYGDFFRIINKQLYIYLKQNCYKIDENSKIRNKSKYCCYNKRIPNFVKELSPNLLKYIYKTLILGDGNKNKNQETYNTSSKRLANDVQEILLKMGFSSYLIKRKDKHLAKIKGRIIKSNQRYEIIRQISKNRFIIRKKHISKIEYKGNVFSVEVPNGIVYVRRNNHQCWSGNSKTGYAIIKTNTNYVEINTGIIALGGIKNWNDRFDYLMTFFKDIMTKDEDLVIEEVFVGINRKASLLLAKYGAIVYATGRQCGIKNINFITASSARKKVGIRGKQKKKISAINFVSKFLAIKSDDVSDGVILALTGLVIEPKLGDYLK